MVHHVHWIFSWVLVTYRAFVRFLTFHLGLILWRLAGGCKALHLSHDLDLFLLMFIVRYFQASGGWFDNA